MALPLMAVLGALPALMKLVGKGQGVGTLVGEIVGDFKDRPAEQAKILAEIDRLGPENDAGHKRLQEKLAAAALR